MAWKPDIILTNTTYIEEFFNLQFDGMQDVDHCVGIKVATDIGSGYGMNHFAWNLYCGDDSSPVGWTYKGSQRFEQYSTSSVKYYSIDSYYCAKVVGTMFAVSSSVSVPIQIKFAVDDPSYSPPQGGDR